MVFQKNATVISQSVNIRVLILVKLQVFSLRVFLAILTM